MFKYIPGGKLLLCGLIILLFPLMLPAQQVPPAAYLDTSLPVETRVDDLISRLTLQEKASQMVNQSKAIPRLNIPEYNWWNECLHGVARAGYATVFPQAIGLAASWNTDLIFKVSDVISTEARAKYNEAVKNNDRDIYKGLTFWTPNINIFRDPRWGRGQETYGEDPFLTSRIGVSFIEGLQGDDPKYFKTIATPKHYAVHSGPEPERHRFNAVVSDFDLYDTYLPAFEACVKEGGAYSVMCAYNRFDGAACCGSNRLLNDILRNEWGFQGYIVSDCGAIDDIFLHHKIVPTGAEAAAIAVKAGTDLECGRVYETAIIEAVNKGLLTDNDLNTSLKRLFTARFKLGMFDPPAMVKYNSIPYSENASPEHRQLSLQAARESIVLLKNSGSTLPLKKNIKRIAVIGPTADSYSMLLGNYNGTPTSYVTPLQGIKNKAGDIEVVFEQGCDLVQEGSIKNSLSPSMVSSGNEKGLQAEFFDNINLEGTPFFTKTDKLDNPNMIYGTREPNLRYRSQYSIRWSGILKVPETGEYRFSLKGNDGYRMYIDNNIMIDNWNAAVDSDPSVKSMNLEAGKNYNIKIEYHRSASNGGWPNLYVEWEQLNVDHFKRAAEAAAGADAVIFVGGITAQLEGEEMRVDYPGFKGGDRTSLNLPGVQEKLLKVLHKTGKPVILVLTGGSALAVNWADENLAAIMQVWYPGEEGGNAIADVLFGNYNPAGRLPVTFYKSADQLPPFDDYNMAGRTYRYFKGDPLYSFGYGLSYTNFEYSSLKIPAEAKPGEDINVSVEVTNTGKTAGDEVVQLYIKNMDAEVTVPLHSLQGFKRIHLNPGEKKTVKFTIRPVQFSVIKENKRIVEPGKYNITLGGCQPGVKSSSSGTITKQLTLSGESYVVQNLSTL